MRSGTEQVQGFALNGIGKIYFIKGDHRKALLYYNESLTVRKKIGHKIGEVSTLIDIGRVYFKQGKNAKAIEVLEKAMNISTRIKHKEGVSQSGEILSQVYEKTGKTKKIGHKIGEVSTLIDIGRVYFKQGKNAKAIEVLEKA